MDKVKISFDQKKYEVNHKRLIELSENKLPELRNEVSTKFGIDLTSEIFQDIISNAGKLISKQIQKDFNSDLKALKMVAAKGVLTRQFEDTKKQLTEVINTYADLQILLKYGSMSENSNYTFNKDYEELLKEECTKYLTDEKEIALYHQKEIAVREFEKFRSMVKISRIASIPVQTFAHMLMSNDILDFDTLAHG